MYEEKKLPPQLHEDIIKERDKKLSELNTEIVSNPESEWLEYNVAEGFKVKLPSRAVIEAEALIQDVSGNLKLFQGGPNTLRDHGDIVKNPLSISLIMSGIFQDNKDWEGIKVRIAIQRGMSLYEDEMEKMDYDYTKPGYKQIRSSFNSADKALKALDHLRPMSY